MDVANFRKHFPPLMQEDAPVYLDNACMTLRPTEVIEAIGLSMTKRTEETGLEVVPLSSTTVN